ncbi:MAG TPA: hypothetical protein VFV33_19610, partial [Gemmatimonadaceae bacterium]|nr:hypothetical protein [Gemmatimonadaceae bacterium]
MRSIPRPTIALALFLALVTLGDIAVAQRPTGGRPAAGAGATRGDSARTTSPYTSELFGGLRARSIGPAMTSGRVMSVAVHPANPGIIYVGTASGGIWKSVSGGASWQPVFDREGSY